MSPFTFTTNKIKNITLSIFLTGCQEMMKPVFSKTYLACQSRIFSMLSLSASIRKYGDVFL